MDPIGLEMVVQLGFENISVFPIDDGEHHRWRRTVTPDLHQTRQGITGLADLDSFGQGALKHIHERCRHLFFPLPAKHLFHVGVIQVLAPRFAHAASRQGKVVLARVGLVSWRMKCSWRSAMLKAPIATSCWLPNAAASATRPGKNRKKNRSARSESALATSTCLSVRPGRIKAGSSSSRWLVVRNKARPSDEAIPSKALRSPLNVRSD